MNVWPAILPKAEARIFAVMFRYKEEGLVIEFWRLFLCNDFLAMFLEHAIIIPASMPLLEQFFPPKTPVPDWLYLFTLGLFKKF